MPTVLVEFGLIEFLCSLNLSQILLFVMPIYCGLILQCPDPLLQVIQYITLVDKQSNLDKIGKISFVVEDKTDLENLGEFLHKLQFLLQCLKPNFSLTDCLFITALGNLALTKNSRIFLGLVHVTIGGWGKILFNRGFLVMTLQKRYKILET